jgi:outer membrane protein TolC
LEAANLDFNRNVQNTVFSVQKSYFSHQAALAQKEAAAANLAFSQTTLRMVEAQKNSGLATEPELLIARKSLSESEFEVSSADRNVQVTLGNLRTASGLPANAPLKIDPSLETTQIETFSGKVDQLIDTALANRPDLAARSAEIRASQAAIERAKSDFLPKLSLQGDYDSHSFGFYAQQGKASGAYYGNYNQMGVFAVLSWDLFDGFEREAKLKKRQAEEAEARANADTTSLTTTRDVWTAYNDSIKARKQVSYTDSLLASAKENFASLQAAFQNGLATITDLYASQSALANAQYERAGAEADYLTSLAFLSLSMGHFSPEKGTQ